MSTATALREAATGQGQRPKTIFDHMDNPRFARGIAAVAGKFMTADRMLRLCVNAVKKTPKLMQCDPQSVLGAMMASAALGLEPNTVQQQAFLIPYKRRAKIGNEWVDVFDCQFQVGARGFITLAYRSPQIKLITSGAIHQGDKWEQEEGSQAFLKYAKTLGDRGPLLGAFSYVRFTSGDEGACVLPLDELMKIRSRSETYRSLAERLRVAENEKDRAKAQAAYDDQPWVMWADDMAAKSATKKHAKQLPLTHADTLAIAADLDDRGEAGVLDMKAFADPDFTRSVLADEEAPPVLENEPTEGFTASGEAFGATGRQAEKVAAGKPAAAASNAEAKPAAKKPTKAAAEDAVRTYAQVADAIQKAKDRDGAALELDTARNLPTDQYDDLVVLFNKHWSA